MIQEAVSREPLAGHPRPELQLLAMREIIRATSVALPLDDILAMIANMAIIVFDATTAWFMLAEDGRLRTTLSRGRSAEAVAATACEGQTSPTCAAAAGDQPLILRPHDISPQDPVLGALAHEQESIVLLPLKAGEQTLGLLGATVTPEASLDVSFLTTLAEQAANAIARAQSREEARTWHERLDAVFERMAEPVLVFDPEGKVALINAAAGELLQGRGVLVGDRVATVLEKARLTDSRGRPMRAEDTAAGRALRGEQVENIEEDLVVPGSPTRHLLASGRPLLVGRQGTGAVVVWRDITYIKEIERMRSEFLSMVSHELRTPLTAVLGYTQLLQRQLARGRPPEDLADRLRTVSDQAKRVNDLVEDLLDASRAEAGRFVLRLEDADLAALARQSVDAAAALSPDHRFRLDLPPEIPPVRADPRRIAQVLDNLLSNASKFSPSGTEITVRVQVEPRRVVVSVADQGIGIPKEDLATIFVPFHRVRQVAGKRVKGVGLGLYISHSIVESHGGDMWVHSELGRGSTFYFSIPRP